MQPTVGRAEIREAAGRLSGYIRRTPVLTVDGAELGTKGTLSLKLEYLQQSGSFKARGAGNAILGRRLPEVGVAAASGGNHGAAVAWAAQQIGVPAHIFVPAIASPVKVERLRSYGADVAQVGSVHAEAQAASENFVAETGAKPIHAFDDPDVLAGAGTVAQELEMQTALLDTVMLACGGGGLAGGVAAWFNGGTRPVKIVVCETEGTPTYARARQAGYPVEVKVSGIAGDSLGASRLGHDSFAALTKAEAESFLVTDTEALAAREFVWDQFRILLEPAAAVPIAVLLTRKFVPAPGSHTAVILCGANTPIEPL